VLRHVGVLVEVQLHALPHAMSTTLDT
jgi:hypothetical protein